MTRKRIILMGAILTTAGVGTVLAQTSVDGLDLEAINRRAQDKVTALNELVDSVVARQNTDTTSSANAQNTVTAAKANLGAAARRASSPPAQTAGIDLDAMVGDAARSLQPTAPPTPQFLAFASLAMPEEALRQMIDNVSRAGGVVVFRGFAPGGPGAFMKGLSQAIAPGTQPHIGIDPRLFSAFHVEAVPMYVVLSAGFAPCSGADCTSTPPPFDRLSGNVTAAFALETIADGNGPGAPIARAAFNALKAKP